MEEYPPELLDALAADIRSWPEVVKLDMGYPGKSRIQFWPLRLKDNFWERRNDNAYIISEPTEFVIDHTAPNYPSRANGADRRSGGGGDSGHWTVAIKAVSFGHPHACRWGFGNVAAGRVCPGTQEFHPGDPFQVFAELRNWYVGASTDGVCFHNQKPDIEAWWETKGAKFFEKYPEAYYIDPTAGLKQRKVLVPADVGVKGGVVAV